MAQYAGKTVWVLLDYVCYVPICSKLKIVLEKHKEWPEICDILGKKKSDRNITQLVQQENDALSVELTVAMFVLFQETRGR